MTWSRRSLLSVALVFVLATPLATQSQDRWVGTWGTAVVARTVPPAAANAPPPVHVNNQTHRQIVRVSAAAIVPGSGRPLPFEGTSVGGVANGYYRPTPWTSPC